MAITEKNVEKWAQKKNAKKLVKALSVDSIETRIMAIKALGAITNDEGAMNKLISLLQDPNALIRAATVEALGTMGNKRSIEFVRQLWNNESDEEVREKARLATIAIKSKMTNDEKFS